MAHELEAEDFKSLLNLCLFEDMYLLNGELLMQVKGIAMGNCAALPLTIIFMDNIEKDMIAKCTSIALWKRYIDDIFFIAVDPPDTLLAAANTINPFIQFTLEKSDNNKLPFLDVMVSVENGRFEFELYIKPSHSGASLPYDAHAPSSRKRNLIMSENIRAMRNSSNCHRTESVQKVNQRLRMNGYPSTMIANTLRNINFNPRAKTEYIDFMVIPYISDKQMQPTEQACMTK